MNLDNTLLIPPEHHVPDTERTAAKQILNCTDHMLDKLVHNGLTHHEDRFDERDLFNIALHSRTGTTVPEQAFAFTLRWMRGSTEDLLAERESRFSLTLSCGCTKAAFAEPRCDLYDGDVSNTTITDTTLTSTIRTTGTRQPRSATLSRLAREFAEMGIRWVKLPETLRDNESLLTTHRIATCESASTYLARRCQEAGLEARTRIGWVIGMLDLVHAWVEVTDEEGEMKILDPIFEGFAAGVDRANPLLSDAAISLRTNRLVPTGLAVGDRVTQHDCTLPVTTKMEKA